MKKHTGQEIKSTVNLFVNALIYINSIASSLLVLNVLITSPSGISNTVQVIIILFLSLIPLFFLVSAIIEINKLIHSYKNKQWGSKVQVKITLIIFILAVLLCIPAGGFLELALLKSLERPLQDTFQTTFNLSLQALSSAIDEESTILQKTAIYYALPAVSKPEYQSAAMLLTYLTAHDPSIAGIDFITDNALSIDFAGREDIRLEKTVLSQHGFLGKFARARESWGHYFLYHAFKQTVEGKQQWINIIITRIYNPIYEQAALAVNSSKKALKQEIVLFGSIKTFVIFFSICFIVQLTGIAVLFSIYAGQIIYKPLHDLHIVISDIIRGNLNRRFLVVPNNETGALMEDFNRMMDSLERNMGAAIHSEKMNVWQDIARKLAHELKNPLTPIKLSAERVLKRFSQDPEHIGEILEKSMMAIIQEVLTMDNLLTDFRDFSKLPEPQFDWIPLKEIVSEAVMLFSASFPRMKFLFDTIPQNLTILADRSYLNQIFRNLILNAAEASQGACTLTISADLVKMPDSLYCRIRVHDDGPGIPDEILPKIFAPYFTTKEQGTGLGLVIVEHAVTSHGGTIHVESKLGSGTAFIIDLPMRTSLLDQENT
ncbi:MAG TPA: ATP-binding protein [Spirochaetales bacterium]|nr:ATP-binding protein [Spirochaetales bacterium]